MQCQVIELTGRPCSYKGKYMCPTGALGKYSHRGPRDAIEVSLCGRHFRSVRKLPDVDVRIRRAQAFSFFLHGVSKEPVWDEYLHLSVPLKDLIHKRPIQPKTGKSQQTPATRAAIEDPDFVPIYLSIEGDRVVMKEVVMEPLSSPLAGQFTIGRSVREIPLRDLVNNESSLRALYYAYHYNDGSVKTESFKNSGVTQLPVEELLVKLRREIPNLPDLERIEQRQDQQEQEQQQQAEVMLGQGDQIMRLEAQMAALPAMVQQMCERSSERLRAEMEQRLDQFAQTMLGAIRQLRQ